LSVGGRGGGHVINACNECLNVKTRRKRDEMMRPSSEVRKLF